ncbi:cyclin-T1 isoform X2 [Oxyura jamaicensis]|uniref:cyclin-T1 isoform X2 n=1 Tax=Oxyura jamaicensis TaxID=8884 RepID=UPI0015A5ED57|nr:cyclin-T1 isoform X2 [Oxyura jamaicensis]
MEASAVGGAGGAAGRRWYFSREQLERSPSRRAGLDPDKELSYRQQAANLLQDMGQRLNVSQLTINTAIVYMHRFYMVQSFTQFHRNSVAPAALFLAAKVEEQPHKLEHVIKVAHACLHPQEPPPDTRSEAYLQQAQDLVILESIILQTLGFEITIDHPHTHVVKCTQLVRASKDLAQTSYFMATNRTDSRIPADPRENSQQAQTHPELAGLAGSQEVEGRRPQRRQEPLGADHPQHDFEEQQLGHEHRRLDEHVDVLDRRRGAVPAALERFPPRAERGGGVAAGALAVPASSPQAGSWPGPQD